MLAWRGRRHSFNDAKYVTHSNMRRTNVPSNLMRWLHYDSTSIRQAFDERSTAYQRSLSTQWLNTGRWPASRSHADPFIYLGRIAAARPWRGSSNGRSAVELQSNRSFNHRLSQHTSSPRRQNSCVSHGACGLVVDVGPTGSAASNSLLVEKVASTRACLHIGQETAWLRGICEQVNFRLTEFIVWKAVRAEPGLNRSHRSPIGPFASFDFRGILSNSKHSWQWIVRNECSVDLLRGCCNRRPVCCEYMNNVLTHVMGAVDAYFCNF